MSDFKAKMHQIRFLLGELTALYLRGLLLRGWRGRGREGKRERERVREDMGGERRGGLPPPIGVPGSASEKVCALNIFEHSA